MITTHKLVAFGGLFKNENGVQIETDSFIKLIPDQAQREKIEKIISDEEKGNENAKSPKC